MDSIDKKFYFLFLIIAATLFFVVFYFDGTGGGGDSTFHYLYAKYALTHPENFFNHWAKPIYTLLAFPFAQFGFTGMKIFNVTMSLIACLFTYKILRIFNTTNREWITVILFSIILFVTVTLSGLTEPLSAAMLMLSIYFIVSDKNKIGISIISFLPFVRSEGLVIMGVFFIYLLVTKKIKFIPWLAMGHVILSLAGSFYYHDLLWVFNKIPYAHIGSVYGKGNWIHFIEQLFFQVGLFEYVLLFVGGISMIFYIVTKPKKPTFFHEKLWLVYGCFIAFFIAHTSFWALGTFNSMGLSRVFVSVMPLIAMIVLDGLNFIEVNTSKLSTTFGSYFKYILLVCITLFPFLDNPASYKIEEDFKLNKVQLLIKKSVTPYLHSLEKYKRMVVSDISVPYFADVDLFDKKTCRLFRDTIDFNKIDTDEVVVWDNWFGVVESGISLDSLANNHSLSMDTTFATKNEDGNEIMFAIFSKKEKANQ